MKVAGFNNQGFQSAAKAAGGKAQGKEKSSFESLLGEAPERGDSQAEESAGGLREQYPQSQTQSQTKPQAQASRQTQNDDVDRSGDDADPSAEMMPNGQGAPSLGTPGLESRGVIPQVNPAYVNPMNQPTQPGKGDDAANTLTRRVVWNDFLRKMNDLGVSPEDIMKAFGSLSEKDLAQPPEMSLDKIVAALGLQGPQAAQAKQFFSELLAKTKSKNFGEEVAASSKQLSLSLMSQRDLQRKSLLKNIDNLGNNFFMKNQPAPKADPTSQEQPALAADGKPMMMPLPEGPQNSLSQMQTPAMMTGNGLSLPETPNGLPQSADMNGLVDQMQAPSAEDKKSIEEMLKNLTAPGAKHATDAAMAAAPAAAGASGASALTAQLPAPAAMPAGAIHALNGIFGGGAAQKDASDDASGDDSSDMAALSSALNGANRMDGAQGLKGEFQAALNAKVPGQGQPTVAVPELVQQANLMVKEGGGAMKVTLHPDGLGEVALRVSVQDGKVNVQMVTESDEAKKMIERTIGDLKSGLAQNHLHVDSIKIDTATNLGKQLEQQYQEAQRQQAHQALEQFRQEGGGQWRRSFFDTGIVNPYRSQGDAPRDAQAPASARARSASSRRLDLVA